MNEHLYIIIVPLNFIIISLRCYKQLENFEASQNKEMINICVMENIRLKNFVVACYMQLLNHCPILK